MHLMTKGRKWPLQDATPGAAGGGEAAPAAAPAAPDPAAAPAAAPASILGQAAAAAPAPAPDAAPAIAEVIPAKYQVKGADGNIDLEASARKVAEAHAALEKRMGAGEAPPKAPEEYAINVPEAHKAAFDADALKADEKLQEFVKGAHGLGFNQKQLDFVMGAWFDRATALADGGAAVTVEQATQELRGEWTTDAEFKANIGSAFRAFNAYASPADRERMDEIGNNPIVLRLLANIGREIKEDTNPTGAGTVDAQSWQDEVANLRASEAYTNDRHPEHAKVMAKLNALYEKRYGNAPRRLGGGATLPIRS